MITIEWLQGQIETLTERKNEAEWRMAQAKRSLLAANWEYREAISAYNDLDGLVSGLKGELAYQERKSCSK